MYRVFTTSYVKDQVRIAIPERETPRARVESLEAVHDDFRDLNKQVSKDLASARETDQELRFEAGRF